MHDLFSKLIRILKLTHEDYTKSVKFAMKLWYAGKPIGDWRSTGTRRGIGKYITDHTIGKLAEIAFSKFIEINWKVKGELDFNIYPGASTIDQGDLVAVEANGKKRTPGIKIDVKSTRKTSKWALLDLKEFENRPYEVYIWFKVGLPLNHLARPIFKAVRNHNLDEIEKMIPKLEEIEVEPAGIEYRGEIESNGEKFMRGDDVYNPNSSKKGKLFTAKTDNIGVPISKLKNEDDDWNNLIKKI